MNHLLHTCANCDAPIGADLRPLAGCWWWGQTEATFRREGRTEQEIARWRRSGGDPPCEGNAYELWQSRRDRRSALIFFGVIGAGLLVAVALHLFG